MRLRCDYHPLLAAASAALVSLIAACVALPPPASLVYPATEVGLVVEDYHGVRVADPYRGFEDLNSPATRDWIERQNALSQPWLEQLPQRPWIKQRLGQLFTYERYGVPVKEGGRYFYLHNDGRQNQAALFVTEDLAQPGRVLIDPNLIRGDATVALARFIPSPDGRRLAYALSDGGTDWKTWYLRDVDANADLPDIIRDTKFTNVSWARDSSGFYYSRYPGADDQKQPVIFFHRLGDAQAADRLVYAVTDHPTRVPEGRVTEDGRYLVITIDDGTLSNGVSVLRLKNGGRDGATQGQAPQKLFAAFDGLYTYAGSRAARNSSELFFRSSAGAPRGRLIALDPDMPPADRLRVVVPEKDHVLAQSALLGGRLFAIYLQDAHAQALLYEVDGRAAGQIALPGIGDVVAFNGSGTDTEAFFSYSDFFTPTQVFRLDTQRAAATLWRAPQLPASTRDYVTEQVFYASKDGTRIPMFLVHRRGLPRNGRQPVLLYGYGGFDISVTPSFSPATLVWLEMGGVYAVANLRGGGEYGEAWHRAGARANKQNVFDDFIAAAEYLIAQRYTSPKHLAMDGASNGGLLVGAVLTQRPELFGAALPQVGVLDMLRYHRASANARLWADDYGLSDDAADFRAQFAYSPVHNVRPRCYPPTLITTADHDDRVVPWHSFKFAAALQRAQHCARPVLIRVETRAGHGAGKPLWMQVENQADRWAFLAAALGIRVPP